MQNFGWMALLIIASGVGGYIGAYLKKRGENLATHDDLDKLVTQMQATTEAAKRIEARISNEIWDRQKLWEMKRDTAISVIQAMDAAKHALMEYSAKRICMKQGDCDPNRFGIVLNASLLWTERITNFDAKRAVAALILSKELNGALWKVQQALRGGYSDLYEGKVSSYDEIGALIRDRIIDAIALSRNELGIPAEEVLGQFNGSALYSLDEEIGYTSEISKNQEN